MANPNTLPYIRHQDLQIDDMALYHQFLVYMQGQNYSDGLVLLANNAQQLNGKAYVANLINTITSGISNLQHRFDNSVIIYLSAMTNTFMTWVDNFKQMGEWSDTATYEKNNFVVYDNEIYMAIHDIPTGYMPTNSTYWLYLGLRGFQGVPGVGVNIVGDWDASTTYQQNDIVVKNGQLYLALTSNSGADPESSPDQWLLFCSIEPGVINVGTLPPANPVNNEIWFQTQVDPLTQTEATPLIGIFKRYVYNTNIWEEMYPDTTFTLMDNYETFQVYVAIVNETIATTEWVQGTDSVTWRYSNPMIGNDNVVLVYPGESMTEDQYVEYSKLKLTFDNNTMVLSIEEAPTVDIPIRIKIT